jgi:hypothetical protein
MTPVLNTVARIVPVQPVSGSAQRWAPSPDKFLGLDALSVGQPIQGRVLSNSQTEATVLIGAQPVRMELPVKVSVGDTLQLVFSGRNPHPVFLLAAIDRPPHVATHFSGAALLLGELMALTHDKQVPASVHSQNPLLDEAPLYPALLAIGLRSALSKSGLFYESHLGDWINGNYPLAGLLQEPQGRLSFSALAQREGSPDLTDMAAAQPRIMNVTTAMSVPSPLPSPSGRGGRSVADATFTLNDRINPTGGNVWASPVDSPADSESVIAPEMHNLIAQQLQLLENHSLIWRGEAWPGQAMEWEVAREYVEDTSRDGETTSPSTVWATEIKLDLPSLGMVTLNIRLDAQCNFDVHLAADDGTSSSVMELARPEIMQKLLAAGCNIQSLLVEKEKDGLS